MEKSSRKKLAMRFVPKDLPIGEALDRIINTCFEADAMVVACLRQREVKLEVVRTYKNKQGKAYEKAQKAALEADRLTERANAFQTAKLKLWGDMVRLYTTYSGDSTKGIIIAYYLIKNYPTDTIAKYVKKPKDFVERTIDGLRTLIIDLTFCREYAPSDYEKLLKKSAKQKAN